MVSFSPLPIDVSRGRSLDRLQDVSELDLRLDVEHRVNVVRHHAPREQAISIAVKEVHRIGDDPPDLRATQQAFALGMIEPSVDFRFVELLKALQFDRRQRSLLLAGAHTNRRSFEAECLCRGGRN